jgi:hypothetical protein
VPAKREAQPAKIRGLVGKNENRSRHLRQVRTRAPLSVLSACRSLKCRSPVLISPLFVADAHRRLFLRRCDICDWKIPVGQQDLEPPLFFALESHLVRPELLNK